MTKATKFIVIGRHDSERNSWRENGDIRHVVSGHNAESAAWTAAHKAHSTLGGCDGSDSLTTVLRRSERIGSRKAADLLEKLENKMQDHYYEHSGWLYVECDFWAAHVIQPDMSLAVRE